MLTLMASPKVRMINVRLTPEMHEAFKIVCDLRGASMSSLLHQFIVKSIREEKDREPSAFKTMSPNGIKLAQNSKRAMQILQPKQVSKGSDDKRQRKTG